MDQDSSPLASVLRSSLLIFLLGGVGLAVLAFGVYEMLQPGGDDEIVIEKAQPATADTGVSEGSVIMVDVSGAVGKPGVYELPQESRVNDALIKAGGISSEANHEAVAKQINLATKLSDGQKLYIPFQGEDNAGISQGGSGVQGVTTETPSDLISINNASEKELESLPGVGEVTAGKILNNRPYTTLNDLVTKKGVSASVFEKIKDLISL